MISSVARDLRKLFSMRDRRRAVSRAKGKGRGAGGGKVIMYDGRRESGTVNEWCWESVVVVW